MVRCAHLLMTVRFCFAFLQRLKQTDTKNGSGRSGHTND